jgi:hypothetical protein
VQLAAPKQPGSKPELEKFLFYRGVGDFATPLNVSMEPGGRVSLFNTGAQTISDLFILSIKDKAGSLIALDKLLPGAHEDAILNSAQILKLDMLQTKIGEAMARALVADGLFTREAVAMVNTWKDSWFTEEGVRVLYLLPRPWTDETLPMSINPKPKHLARVMVGRAELITAETERQLAAGLALAKQDRQAGRATTPTRGSPVGTLRGTGVEPGLDSVGAAAGRPRRAPWSALGRLIKLEGSEVSNLSI